jgi:CRISPR/Cas system-associated endoribonuclease Cas2
MERFSNKHYELLTSNVKRYLLNAPDTITDVEMGKAINMIVEMVGRESMRDMREERNK